MINWGMKLVKSVFKYFSYDSAVQPAMLKPPLVSVLIPAYNRPHYLQKALQSALDQTYEPIEIIICDDSTNDEVKSMMIPYIEKYPNIKYVKNPSVLFLRNWHKCFELSSGEYINYLMDDDLFEPDKIEKMMSYFLQRDDITLATSWRQIIDGEGNPLPAIPETMKLYEQTAIVNGIELGNYVLTRCRNVIGEPTSVLFRKKDLVEPFGVYHGRQYVLLNDLVSWLSLLSKGNAVYFAETLSYFRRHQDQNSLKVPIVAKGVDEWLECIDSARKDGFLGNDELLKASLNAHREYLQSFRTWYDYRDFRQAADEAMRRIESRLHSL